MIPIGTRIKGLYELQQRIGRGSDGLVYRLRSDDDRAVVLKVPDVAELGLANMWARLTAAERATELATLRERFHWESAARAVASPYVVRVLEYDEAIWRDPSRLPPIPVPGVIVEHVEGWTLNNPPPSLTPSEVLHLVATLCEGLAACHDVGLVHRDLSPKNIMVRDTGGLPQAVIIDFGTARPESHSTFWAGTKSYAPPERGRPAGASGAFQFDTSYDIWPVGIILATMLQGRHPFGALADLEPPESREAALKQAVPDLEGVRAVSPEVARLVAGCLSGDPGERPSARRVATELHRELRRGFSTLDARYGAIQEGFADVRSREDTIEADEAELDERRERLEAQRKALEGREEALRAREQDATRKRAAVDAQGESAALARWSRYSDAEIDGLASVAKALRTWPRQPRGRLLAAAAAGLVAILVGGACGFVLPSILGDGMRAPRAASDGHPAVVPGPDDRPPEVLDEEASTLRPSPTPRRRRPARPVQPGEGDPSPGPIEPNGKGAPPIAPTVAECPTGFLRLPSGSCITRGFVTQQQAGTATPEKDLSDGPGEEDLAAEAIQNCSSHPSGRACLVRTETARSICRSLFGTEARLPRREEAHASSVDVAVVTADPVPLKAVVELLDDGAVSRLPGAETRKFRDRDYLIGSAVVTDWGTRFMASYLWRSGFRCVVP